MDITGNLLRQGKNRKYIGKEKREFSESLPSTVINVTESSSTGYWTHKPSSRRHNVTLSNLSNLSRTAQPSTLSRGTPIRLK